MSGERDRTWMLFDKTSGRVLKLGDDTTSVPPPADEVFDLKKAR